MGGLVEGKVVLVTGAASGIGRASALVFAREGAKVVACDIDEKGGDETLGLVREAGGEGEFLRTDVAREEQVEALVAYAVERFGRLDCAHNNAGITGAVGAVVMLEQGGGAVVNTASGAGFVPTPTLSPYCASKHGILGLTKTAAVENARTGIRVNAVCPGSIDTPMLRAYMKDPQIEKLIRAGQPGGRLGDPAEIAEAAVWLCSDRASFVSGESMLVDGAAIAR
jgi:NAD(P)-dependent dehydrogenase (short-subunit alcohol dehydrogenase family)